MATVTKTIGSGQDYTTIQAWVNDLDDGTNAANDATAYTSGDDAVGEIQDASAFDEEVTISGGGTVGLNSIKLTVASGARHDGTAGTGARIAPSSATQQFILYCDSTVPTVVEWIEVDGGSVAWGSNDRIGIGRDTGTRVDVRNCIVHNVADAEAGIQMEVSAAEGYIVNCIVYDILNSATGAANVSGIAATVPFVDVINCTVYGVTNNGGTGSTTGIEIKDDSRNECWNNLAFGAGGTTSGGVSDFSIGASTTGDYNASGDATADDNGGVNSLINQTVGDFFVSITGGSEDLHLKSGAPAIGAGSDRGTTPTGVNIDIDGRDRDAEGDTWDIGAHQFVSAGAAVTITDTIFKHYYTHLLGGTS